MKRIVVDTDRIVAFVREYYGLSRSDGQKGIGLETDGELVGGVVFDDWTIHNIFMHVASKPGVNWLTRDFLRIVYDYPFNQLGCSRVSAWIEDSNIRSKKFCEHLGYKKEALLSGAARDGGDVHIYRMRKEECKYV